jgi:hypothetical protein
MQLNSVLFPGPGFTMESINYSNVVYIPRNKVYEKDGFEDEEFKVADEGVEDENLMDRPNRTGSLSCQLTCGLVKSSKTHAENSHSLSSVLSESNTDGQKARRLLKQNTAIVHEN